MKCPVDQSVLQMTHREGIEIDYCPTCRGVWLDRGELDKIVERSAGPSRTAPPSGRRDDDRDRGAYNDGRPRRSKRESFLSELFDF